MKTFMTSALTLGAILLGSTTVPELLGWRGDAFAQQGSRYSIVLINESKFAIHEIRMSSSDNPQWGPDLTGDGIVPPGGRFTISNIRPGEWDLRLIDKDGDKCELRKFNVFKNETWHVTTAWLLKCEGFD